MERGYDTLPHPFFANARALFVPTEWWSQCKAEGGLFHFSFTSLKGNQCR